MPRRFRAATAALALSLAPAARAQAPVVTAAGDPSVRNDSIYRFATDSAKYRDLSTRMLLDDRVVRLEVEQFAEQSFNWVPGRQTLRVNRVRVVKPSGEVVNETPSQVQDSDVPAGCPTRSTRTAACGASRSPASRSARSSTTASRRRARCRSRPTTTSGAGA